MHYIVEAIFVGFYTLLIFVPLSYFIQNSWICFFLLGVFKHFLGSILKIHDYYCNDGYRCTISQKREKYVYDKSYLMIECLLEGIYFLGMGIIFFDRYQKSPFFFIFLFGFFTHLIAEFIGLHKYVCKFICVKK